MSRLSLLFVHFLMGYCIATKYEPHLLISEPVEKLEPLISTAETFPQVVFASNVLVDKSLLIKDLIEDDNNVYLITCPRRWGKSINMLMIKTFFEIQLDKNDEKMLPVSSTPNYRLFVDGSGVASEFGDEKRLQSGFLVARHKNIIENYLGQYPVIHIDFGSAQIVNCTDMKIYIASKCSEAFQEHSYARFLYENVMNDKNSDKNIKEDARQRYEQFKRYQNPETVEQWSIGDIVQSLNFLTETLKLHFNKNVVLLMDEYFIPWEEIIEDESQSDVQRSEFLNFYTNFMAATFSTNTNLEKAIITGVLPPFTELRDFLPDASECNLLTGKFMEYYSFNEWDVEKLLDHVNASQSMREEMNYYYNGYTANNQKFVIYNAVSIIDFLNVKHAQPFWIRRGSYGYIIRNFLKIQFFKKKYEALKNGKHIMVKLDNPYISWTDYEVLLKAKYYWPVHDLDQEMVQKFFLLLHATGFLTLTKNARLKPNSVFINLRMPNLEVISSLQTIEFGGSISTGEPEKK